MLTKGGLGRNFFGKWVIPWVSTVRFLVPRINHSQASFRFSSSSLCNNSYDHFHRCYLLIPIEMCSWKGTLGKQSLNSVVYGISFQEREPLEKGQGLPPPKCNQKPDKEIVRVVICSRGVW